MNRIITRRFVSFIRWNQTLSSSRLWAASIGVLLACVATHAGELQLLSVPASSTALPAAGGGDSLMPIVSQDGNLIVFASTANNLVMANTNSPYREPRPQKFNLFLRNRALATTTLLTAGANGNSQGDDDSFPRAISTNGQYVLFESSASNLIAGKTNPSRSVFIRDLAAGTTTLVSVSTNGDFPDGDSSDSVMTPDARWVAFASKADNLVPADTNGLRDVFVRDLQTGQTTLVSVGSMFAQTASYLSASGSDAPEISPDARYVAFLSTATNLVPGVTNLGEVYLRDMATGDITDVSLNARSYSTNVVGFGSPRFTDDEQHIAFSGCVLVGYGYGAPLWFEGKTGGFIFLHNLQDGTDQLITTNFVQGSDTYEHTSTWDMTSDGRFFTYVGTIVFQSHFMLPCIFRSDIQLGGTIVVGPSTNSSPFPTWSSDLPMFDSLGQHALFFCSATNLTTNAVTLSPHLYSYDLATGVTTLIDQGTNGLGSAKDFSGPPVMDRSGRFVVFDASDADLTSGDNNQCIDVFLRDVVNGTTELISCRAPNLASQTFNPLANVHGVSISADGRYAAFWGVGNGVVDGYTNSYPGVFVRDLQMGSNQLVSVDVNGMGRANGSSRQAVISGNGRYVVFTSAATNLVINDTNRATDVFVRDLQTGQTTLVSANKSGNGPGNAASDTPAVSVDGKYAAFLSKAVNLTDWPWVYSPGSMNIFLRDCVNATNYHVTTQGAYSFSMTPDAHYLAFIAPFRSSPTLFAWDSQALSCTYTNTTVLYPSQVSISPSGQWLASVGPVGLTLSDRIAGTNQFLCSSFLGSGPGLRFSSDGRYFVYATPAAMVADDTNGQADVYLYDFRTGASRLVSRNYAGGAPNGPSGSPDISVDGRYVVYESAASDIVPGNNNCTKDIFLFDQQAGTTTLLSASIYGNGSANYESVHPTFTGDGQTVVFQSAAGDLIENDFNQGCDSFTFNLASTNIVSGFVGQIIYIPGSGQPPTITWPAGTSHTYQVQYKDDITDQL